MRKVMKKAKKTVTKTKRPYKRRLQVAHLDDLGWIDEPPKGKTYNNPILIEREKTHGNFSNVARTAQALKHVLRDFPESNFHILEPRKQETLDMICTKMARIIHGNADEPDHLEDIAGYAELAN